MKKLLLLASLALVPAAQADTMRVTVGKPLQQAEALIRRHDYQGALAQVSRARAVGHLTAYEALVVAQVQGIAAAGAGQYVEAASAYETVLDSGGIPAASRAQYAQAIAGFYDQARDYPRTIAWVQKYIAYGGTDPRTRTLLAQAYYMQADYAQAETAVRRDEKTGETLPVTELQLLAASAQKAGDMAGYQSALQALLKADPSPQYWNAAIAGVTAAPDFPDRLTLDVERLRLATGTLTATSDYEDYAERAILAGNPSEAHRVIERGYACGALNDQVDAGHAARLRSLAAKQAASNPAPPLGPVANAQSIGNAADPDGELDLGIAEAAAGDQAAATRHFERVAGPPASRWSAEVALAGLWLIYVRGVGVGIPARPGCKT